jgi:hypothetical protein
LSYRRREVYHLQNGLFHMGEFFLHDLFDGQGGGQIAVGLFGKLGIVRYFCRPAAMDISVWSSLRITARE